MKDIIIGIGYWLIFVIALFTLFVSFEAKGSERYEIKVDNDILEASELLAYTQIGLVEEPGNRGGNVEDYLKSVGIYSPAPYCMAGQYWCYWIACNLIKKPIPIKRTAGAVAQFNYFKEIGKRTDYKPKRHDFIVWKNKNSWTGHIERITKVLNGGWVETIGFNTGSDVRNGGMVIKRLRHINNPLSKLLVQGIAGFSEK